MMAQSKAQTKRSSGASRNAKASNGQGDKAGGSSRGGAAARRSTNSKSRSSPRSSNGRGATASAKRRSSSAAKRTRSPAPKRGAARGQNAGSGVAAAARKAKTPLLAGGATVAGLAGAAALALRSSGRRKVLGVPVGRRNGFRLPGRGGGLKRDARKVTGAVTDAAKRADRFGHRVSRVATTIQKVSETADDAAKEA